MKKNGYLLLELLQNFDKNEKRRFKKFVASSFFGAGEAVANLLDVLVMHINKGSVEQLNLALIYGELFKIEVKYLTDLQHNWLYVKMSLLLKLAKQFLMIEYLMKEKALQTEILQEILLNRKQHRLYEQFFKKQQKQLQQTLKSPGFYKQQYILESGVFQYAQQSGTLARKNNSFEIKHSLGLYYLLNQLDFHLIELSLEEFAAIHQTDTSIYEAIQPLLQLPQFANHPLVKVYQSLIELISKKTDLAFTNLRTNLETHHSEIPVDNLVNFYNTMSNFCILRIRKGKPEYNRFQFDLYQSMDEKNLLIAKDEMLVGNLRNIVNLSCRVKEYDWAVRTLNKYESFIPENIRSAVKDFNLGTIAYYKKDYQKAIDFLFPLPTINLSHDINRRTIMMKAYYELDDDYLETTHTLFRSFEKYIREHKSLTGKSKTSYKNFIRTLINLYRIKHDVTKMKLENVKRKLEAQQLNSNKNWLQEKIAGLE